MRESVVGKGRTTLELAGSALWHLPGRFQLVGLLGAHFGLRCVLFHNVSDTESPFTNGLGITTRRRNFETALTFLTRYYNPVRLQDVIADPDGRKLPPRPVLVTFDDAYASIADVAAPMCYSLKVPAVFFVNAECLDNARLALDNLVAYVANTRGLRVISDAARATGGYAGTGFCSMAEVFNQYLPAISLGGREDFRKIIIELAGIEERPLAEQAQLYLTSRQLRDLSKYDFEIGNHTYSHAHGKALSEEDLSQEIDLNKTVLESKSAKRIRSFSIPYGCAADLTEMIGARLRLTGHEVAFLAGGVANSARAGQSAFDRVSVHGSRDALFFSEIEVLPRLRRLRDGLLGAFVPGVLPLRPTGLCKRFPSSLPEQGAKSMGIASDRREITSHAARERGGN
jgi:peptidoglycan/xylan/chitin deacetylase (PgdA/CDA1 family)